MEENNSLESNGIEIYKTADNQTEITVQFDAETVWLNQQQISQLFDRDRTVITKHINNVFKEGELDQKSNVQKMHIANSDRPVTLYNLDVIISVGYRVKSPRGTQFRQWATQRLKDYLVKGYALNERRLQNNLAELETAVKAIQSVGNTDELRLSEAKGLLEIIAGYTNSFILLNRFDRQDLPTDNLNTNITYEIEYEEAVSAVGELKRQLIEKEEATALFGNQKDNSFQGILGNVVQSFGGDYVYPSIEEQAAHLLYFTIKNHPFTDGNKRIGAFLFVWFLEKNKHRFTQTGKLKINGNALTALALLVAVSNPADKDLMVKLIINLINDEQI